MDNTILRADNWSVTSANLYQQLKNLDHAIDWQVSISKYTPEKQRTISQNAYLHAIFIIIEQHRAASGLTPFGAPGIKMFFKVMHFGITYIKTELGDIQQVQPTRKLGKKKFNEFVEFIRQYCFDNYGEFYVMTPEEWRQWQHEKNK